VTAALALVSALLLLAAPLRARSMPDTLISFFRQAAAEAAVHAGASRVCLRVLPDNAPPAVTQVFAEQLRQQRIDVAGIPADGTPVADPVLTVEVRELQSTTVSRGDSAYLVRLRASLGVFVRQPATGAVPWSRSYALDVTDTLDGHAEEGSRDWLAGAEESWFERWGGPLIITAAALVIAVLLFTVRGS
jgi:hypothetical protein